MTETYNAATKGRTKLKGVLDGLVKKSIENRDGDLISVDDDVEEGARDLMELNDDGGHLKKRRGRKRGRKGGRRDYLPDGSDGSDHNDISHIPHVMTLFDRKVDLALFSSDTPLYIMCREWMSNNPEKFRSVPPHNHTNSLTPSQPNTVTDPTTPTSTTIPPPTPLEKDEKGRTIRMDVPSPQKQYLSKTEFDDRLHKACSDESSDLSECKTAHLKRWREEKKRWRNASIRNQSRYMESLRYLRSIFQK